LKTKSEEFEDFVASPTRWLPLFVDEVDGHDIVGCLDNFLEELRYVRIGRVVGKNVADEAVAKRFLVGGESQGLAEAIALKTIGLNSKVFLVEAFPDGFQFVGGDLQPRIVVQR